MLFFSEDVKRPAIKYNKIKKCLFKILELEGKSPGEISIIFTSDKYLFEINKKYLDRDYLTDVISFNYYKEGLTEGDIYISLERVNENSRIYKVEFENDKVRVLRIKYGPGEKSVMHDHSEGVVVILNDQKAKFTQPNGESFTASPKAGTVFWSKATRHLPENIGSDTTEVIQIELKTN